MHEASRIHGKAIGALVVGALFMLRVVQKVCYGPPVERFAHLPDVSPARSVPRVILVAVIVLFGLFVAGTTYFVYRKHQHNQAEGDSLHLIGMEKPRVEPAGAPRPSSAKPAD